MGPWGLCTSCSSVSYHLAQTPTWRECLGQGKANVPRCSQCPVRTGLGSGTQMLPVQSGQGWGQGRVRGWGSRVGEGSLWGAGAGLQGQRWGLGEQSFSPLDPSISSSCPTHVLPEHPSCSPQDPAVSCHLSETPGPSGPAQMSHCFHRAQLSTLPPSSLSNCEVLRGPCEWLHG